MTDEVWLTNPTLPKGQDIKVPRSAFGSNYVHSGWQIREDQSDPIDPDTIPDEPAAAQNAADTSPTETPPDVDGEPVADEPVTSTTTKKGR